ncbi:MAG: hypothetical protein LBH37_02105 [Oscillospiraceae bacterium]|jgi:hypothetical protein|nr:hypothetical protein [Oscillospiraceae bacterium]
MLGIFCSVFIVILAIIGLIEIFRILVLIAFRAKDESSLIILVPISGHNEKAEFLLRSAVAKLKWLGTIGKQRIICVDNGMDQQTRKICEIIKQEYEFVEICFSNEFEKILKSST